ncbi:hypothetical protein P7K49_008736, partial [Saguinus oedipus]
QNMPSGPDFPRHSWIMGEEKLCWRIDAKDLAIVQSRSAPDRVADERRREPGEAELPDFWHS